MPGLKLGVFNHFPYQFVGEYHDFPRPNAEFDPDKGHQLYAEYLDEFVQADRLGFDVLAFNEHHSKEYNLDVAPNLVTSYLIGQTKRAALLPTGSILPLHNPLRIAEEYAMLDVMSSGRLIAGFEKGGVTNYLAYSVPLEEKDRFEEAWDLIVKAWTTPEPFAWNGKHYHFDAVSVWPRPYQKPHPPIHTAGGGSVEFAAERRASIGLGFTTTNEETKGIFGRYRSAYRRFHGSDPGPGALALARSVYVAESDEKARQESEPHLMHQYRVLYRPSMVANERLQRTANLHLYWADRLFLTVEDYGTISARGNHIAGSPETVAGKILEQRRELGFGTFLGLFRYGSMPHDQVERSMRLFAEEVMPRLKGGD